MRIFLTGGQGMVGRNLQEHGAASGWTLCAPSRAELDLTDYQAVLGMLADFRPDIVIHGAAKVGGIQANSDDPVGFLTGNIDIGRNVVMASHAAGVERLLNIASSSVYPREAPNPLREEQIMTGLLDPGNEGYALAKIMILKLCQFVSRQYSGRAYKTLLPCNLYGRHDHYHGASPHLIPAVMRRIHDAKLAGALTVELWGDGSARREFMYAGDLADGLTQAVAWFDTLPPLMNMGVGHDYSVLDYNQAIAQVVGWDGAFTFDLSKPTGTKQRLVDVSSQTTWGWQPATSLMDGLAASYAYFLQECQS
ncbi:GDP-L-fucose synthase [Sphingobium sp. AN641]|uniref:GDP-L-fucose synthase family protein n=1 Tax=Sphingobium sp. AN641 TaxID=3133443 RepID=UPI0030C1E480